MMMMSTCKKLAVYAAFFLSAFVLHSGHVLASENNKTGIACPSENFAAFFKVFLEDENVQRAFTRTPLTVLNADKNAKPNWIKALKILDSGQVNFPVFPPLQVRKARLLDIHTSGTTDSHAEVTMAHSPSAKDWFLFEKDSTCWKLSSIDYHSSSQTLIQDIRRDKTHSAPKNACPFPDFDTFLKAFMGDEAIQRTFTKSPLMTRYVTDTNDDMIRIIKSLDGREIKFPLMPSLKTILKEAWIFQVVGVSEQNAEVVIKSSNSGSMLMNYLFSKDSSKDA
jgi:hypothetical protein